VRVHKHTICKASMPPGFVPLMYGSLCVLCCDQYYMSVQGCSQALQPLTSTCRHAQALLVQPCLLLCTMPCMQGSCWHTLRACTRAAPCNHITHLWREELLVALEGVRQGHRLAIIPGATAQVSPLEAVVCCMLEPQQGCRA
jgi:hypothetical protein